MIYAQVDAGVLSIGLQHISILLINITHSVRLIRVKPVGVVAQAHIDSITCGSYGSSEQKQYICIGDRSTLWGVSRLSLSVHLYVCGYMHVHWCSSLSLYSAACIYCIELCYVSPALWGVIHMCYMCSSSISYMLTAGCCGCIGSSKSRYLLCRSSVPDLVRQDQIH